MNLSTKHNKEFPRVLISTNTAWSQWSGANTFATLFQDFPNEKIANIYTKADLPDSKVCSRYFRILESKVLKSIFKPSLTTGNEVSVHSSNSQQQEEARSEHKRYAYFRQHRWAIFLWIRELGWRLGKWRSKELDQFLESFQPEVFIFPIQAYWYFNRLNEYIIKKTTPQKTIVYLWDDCFTYKQEPYNPIYYVNRFINRRQVKRIIALSDEVLAINPMMKEEADKEFGVNSTIITKPVLNSTFPPYHHDSTKPIRIVYSGSLVIGRDKSIALLAECLKEVNQNGVKIILDVYSNTELSPAQQRRINVDGICSLRGHLPQNRVFEEQEKADILLFVEDLNNRFNNVARLSFSTKITDYLSRNRAILAIAPKNIAPTKYLIEQDAALVCNNKNEILEALHRIVENPETIANYASKARACGERNHSKSEILSRFKSIVLGQ